jgi:hypothetical protein
MSILLSENQPPLGSQFKSYELNSAINYYLLDPFQYSITKFDYSNPEVVPGALKYNPTNPTNPTNPGGSGGSGPNGNCVDINSSDFKNDPGLIYKGVNFENLLPAYTSVKKSANDFPAQSYHRFLANDGYFNPTEGINNSDLWYYGADKVYDQYGFSGAGLNVQEINHIIFSEPQRGGLNSANLAKYSSTNDYSSTLSSGQQITPVNNKSSWELMNEHPINNNNNCKFFSYNNKYETGSNIPVDKVYSYDSNYTRYIGISSPTSGSMPFAN